MTWLGDQSAKPTDIKRLQLLKERERLIEAIKELKAAPLTSSSLAAKKHRQEDLIKLASRVKSIDVKLGRQIDDA